MYQLCASAVIQEIGWETDFTEIKGLKAKESPQNKKDEAMSHFAASQANPQYFDLNVQKLIF